MEFSAEVSSSANIYKTIKQEHPSKEFILSGGLRRVVLDRVVLEQGHRLGTRDEYLKEPQAQLSTLQDLRNF